MKKIKWVMSIGFLNAERKGEIEVDDEADEEEIRELVEEDAFQFLNLDWAEVN